MSTEAEWETIGLDLAHNYEVQQSGFVIKLDDSSIQGKVVLKITNQLNKARKIKFNWYKIEESNPRRAKRKYHFNSGQTKRFVVPLGKRCYILWKYI